MIPIHRIFAITFFIMVLWVPLAGSAESDGSVITFTGQIVYEDIEGGFWGIITTDDTRYLPLNLPDQYKVQGVMIQGTGTPDQNISTIQMWGQPLVIDSLSFKNGGGPSESAWYQPPEALEEDTLDIIDRMNGPLLMASAALQKGLNSIDEHLSASGRLRAGSGSNDSNLTGILDSLLDEDLGVYESSALDDSGRIIAVSPRTYQSAVGSDVSSEPYVSAMLSYPVPTLSGYLPTVEGRDAVILSYPVFLLNETGPGYISSLIDPSVLVEKTALRVMDGTGYSVMVMQPDGIILYDADSAEIGSSAWTGPRFTSSPSLLQVAAHMQNALAGYDTYEINGAGTPVQKVIVWTTVTLHGTSWRIAVING